MIKKLFALCLFKTSVDAFQMVDVNCSDKATNNTIVESSNGKFYRIICDIDLDNHYLDQVNDLSGSECIEKCANTDSCVSVSYLESLRNCYLKYGVDGSFPDIGSMSAILLDNTYIPNFDIECSVEGEAPKLTSDRNGVLYTVHCDIDYRKALLAEYPNMTREECLNKCSNNKDCSQATYTGHCYLRSNDGIEGPVDAKGYTVFSKLDYCKGYYDVITNECFGDGCLDHRIESASSIYDDSFICNRPCHEDLYYDIYTKKCVLACDATKKEVDSNGVKICSYKSGSTLISKNVMMKKKN